jgi:8-oxo-dGTP diphosphatase
MSMSVVVAAVVEVDGRFFVTRRQDGVPLEGYWEFPGGKVEPGESDEAALVREMREELDAGVEIRHLILSVSHPYPDRTVELHFYACALAGPPPRPLLGQEMRWVTREELRTLRFPPADNELVALLTVPL